MDACALFTWSPAATGSSLSGSSGSLLSLAFSSRHPAVGGPDQKNCCFESLIPSVDLIALTCSHMFFGLAGKL